LAFGCRVLAAWLRRAAALLTLPKLDFHRGFDNGIQALGIADRFKGTGHGMCEVAGFPIRPA
jgi:hypothetical protein